VDPGEIVKLSREGFTSKRFAFPQHTPCVFEHVYFSRPDSIVFGRSVAATREAMGAQLAREHPAEADVVVPVPDSGMYAALGFAREAKIPFALGLVRNHYVGRTFIEPKQAIRDFGAKVKLNPVREVVEGRRIVLVDDSIVRGTTSRKIVRMLRDAGAKELHVRISSPPTVASCHYGIDTPTRRELIASTASVEEIREFVGSDSLGYLSTEGMLHAFGRPQQSTCTACFTGIYPVEIPEEEREKEGVVAKC
jgi:amidophosphoribosyltransferase